MYNIIGNSSSTVIVKQVNETVNESTFKFLSKRTNQVENKVTNIQNMNVSSVKAYGCTLNITQSGSISAVTIQELKEEDVVQLQQEIQTALEAKANTSSTAETQFASTGSADSYTKQDILNKVINITKREITKDTVNKIINDMNSKQQLDVSNVMIDPCGLSLYTEVLKRDPPEYYLKYCDMKKSCDISQDMAIKSVAQQITNSVTAAVLSDTFLSSLSAKSEATGSSKNVGVFQSLGEGIATIWKGIGSAINSLFGGGPFGGILIFLLLGVAAFIAYKVFIARKEAATGAVGMAAAAAAPPNPYGPPPPYGYGAPPRQYY